MARGINKAILVGNLADVPEFKILNNGQTAVATVSLATSEQFKDQQGNVQERTEWHRLVFWGKTAEIAHQYLQKGSQIYVEGKIRTRSYDDQSGQKRYVTEIQVMEMQMLGSKSQGQNQPAPAQPQQSQGQQWQPQSQQQRWQPPQNGNYQQPAQPQQGYQQNRTANIQQPAPQNSQQNSMPAPFPDDPLPF